MKCQKLFFHRLVVLIALFAFLPRVSASANFGRIQSWNRAEAILSGSPTESDLSQWNIDPFLPINKIFFREGKLQVVTGKDFDLRTHYYLVSPRGERIFLRPDGVLDSLYSTKPLGYHREGTTIVFRVFAPRAHWVRLVLFPDYRATRGKEWPMKRDSQGIWEYRAPADWTGKYYGYRVWGPTGEGEMFDSTVVVADPYSPAVVTRNHFLHPAKTLILPPEDFDWEGDTWLALAPDELIIYEMHVRDLTADSTSGLPAKVRGTYLGLISEEQQGGLPYIRNLGVNAVELLPIQEFANIEPPYRDPEAPVYNTWNPYARNHWGYMTSYFFAPESYYASGGTMQPGAYNGIYGQQVREFKEVVKAFHHNGIAVIMDVVYNHVSQYDLNPLKYLDKFYYFRLNPDCSFTSVSGCGNDLKTERPMVRRLILDSVRHWMEEYHVDGFRFDLAKMIDWETCDAIIQMAREINPHAIIIAEPWGGGYDPAGFSQHGWASWNDQFRNGVKGREPHDDPGFIFGAWQNANNRETLKRFVMGSLREYGGQYLQVSHSINYLASHDDYTLGDFIRLGLGKADEHTRITEPDSFVRLSAEELRLHRLAALFLFTSRGNIMLAEGQEFARSKIIAPTAAPDTNRGRIDHNSYEKDNPTNWLNFRQAAINRELVDYYRGLIALRKAHPAFRQATPEQVRFFDQPDSLFLTYRIDTREHQYLVLLNGNPRKSQKFTLPPGIWGILADSKKALADSFRFVKTSQVVLPSTSGMILIKNIP